MICPNCNANLEGDLIFEDFLELYGDEQKALETAAMYGATKTEGRWGREIGIYDIVRDRVAEWQCPDCGHVWLRRNVK